MHKIFLAKKGIPEYLYGATRLSIHNTVRTVGVHSFRAHPQSCDYIPSHPIQCRDRSRRVFTDRADIAGTKRESVVPAHPPIAVPGDR